MDWSPVPSQNIQIVFWVSHGVPIAPNMSEAMCFDIRTNLLGLEESLKNHRKSLFSYLKGKSGETAVKKDFDPSPPISHVTSKRNNRLLTIKLCLKPLRYVRGNVFWYPNQYLRFWRKFEKSSKITIFSYLRGKCGEIAVKGILIKIDWSPIPSQNVQIVF